MSNYATIGRFGEDLQVNMNEGLSLCLMDLGPETRSANGPTAANRFGPASDACQAFMSEYCANGWDNYCDIYYAQNNVAETRLFPNNFAPRSEFCSVSLGDSLLQNAAQLRFFNLPCNRTWQEPLDYTNASSPMITKYIDRRDMSQATLNSRTFNSRTVDTDPLMQRMLTNPNAVEQELKAMYYLSNNPKFRGTESDISNTKTGKILRSFFGN